MAETKQISRQSRYKMGNSVLNIYGYAIVGASAIQPFLVNGTLLSVAQIVGVATGLFLHAFALYSAPKGEPR